MGRRGRKREDLTGQKFGRWTVLGPAEDKNNRSYWICQCDCEDKTIKIIKGSSLKNGTSDNCGCIKKERIREKMKKHNSYIFHGDYFECIDDKGNSFLADSDDYEIVKQYYWTISAQGYAVANKKRPENGIYFMHRILTNCPPNLEVDHINRIRTDNRKKNLRVCTHTENMKNAPNLFGRGNPSPIFARYFIKDYECLGPFTTREQAQQVYELIKEKEKDI